MISRITASAIVVAVALGGCDAAVPSPTAPSVVPGTSAAPSTSTAPVSTGSPVAPTAVPSASPALARVADTIPPNAGAPDGGLGLTWSRRYAGSGSGTGIVEGPAGWASVVFHDSGAPTTILLSRDLRTWNESQLDERAGRSGAWVLAASEGRYVIPGDQACLWSTDARDWEACTAAGAEGGRLDVNAAASDGRGFVAWRAFPAADGVWASRDGQTWSRVTLPGAPAVIVDAVASVSPGGYVLAGRGAATTAELDAVEGPAIRFAARPGTQGVWVSDDGFSWTSVPLGSGFEAARFTSIAAGGPGGGIVAVGQATSLCGPGTAAPVCGELAGGTLDIEPDLGVWRWTQSDGWGRLRGQGFPIVEPDAGQSRIVATESRWLLVGARLRADATWVLDTTAPGVVAGSEDGTAWWSVGTRLLAAGAQDYAIDGIATSAERLVFVANWHGPGIGDEHVEIWASPSFDGD